MDSNPSAGNVPFQLRHRLPRSAHAYDTHRVAARALDRVNGRWRLGFASGLDYFFAACMPFVLPALEASYLGQPLPEGWEWLPELDELLAQLLEALEGWLGQRSRKPREERIVDMLRRFGQDPLPRLTSPAPAQPARATRRPSLVPRGLPHQIRGPRAPAPSFAFGFRRRRMAGG